jgi:hypothetical protein
MLVIVQNLRAWFICIKTWMPYLPKNQQTNSFIPSDIVHTLKYVIYADPKELKQQRDRERIHKIGKRLIRQCEAYRQKETIVADINGT